MEFLLSDVIVLPTNKTNVKPQAPCWLSNDLMELKYQVENETPVNQFMSIVGDYFVTADGLNFRFAYMQPEPTTTQPVTNRQVSEWLRTFNGEVLVGSKVFTNWVYELSQSDEPVPEDLYGRKFGEEEWVPLRTVLLEENNVHCFKTN